MKEYFKLQFKMTNRRFRDMVSEPIVAYFILIVGFILLSIYLFNKTEFAEYIYVFISLSITANLSEIKRNEFLKTCFKNNELKLIRMIENLIVTVPFVIFLLYKQLYISSSILFILSALLALVNFKTTINFTIPTPFYKKPFEFTVGFRNTFYLFPITYILVGIAVSVNNFNLGIFSMLLVFLISFSYYTKPENEYYVWSYNLTPKQFLFDKIKTAVWYVSLLNIPVVLLLGISFSQDLHYIALFLLAGYAFLICMIGAKYSAYPNQINVSQGILIAISLYFPPLLIITIPYFFSQSIKRLKPFLK